MAALLAEAVDGVDERARRVGVADAVELHVEGRRAHADADAARIDRFGALLDTRAERVEIEVRVVDQAVAAVVERARGVAVDRARAQALADGGGKLLLGRDVEPAGQIVEAVELDEGQLAGAARLELGRGRRGEGVGVVEPAAGLTLGAGPGEQAARHAEGEEDAIVQGRELIADDQQGRRRAAWRLEAHDHGLEPAAVVDREQQLAQDRLRLGRRQREQRPALELGRRHAEQGRDRARGIADDMAGIELEQDVGGAERKRDETVAVGANRRRVVRRRPSGRRALPLFRGIARHAIPSFAKTPGAVAAWRSWLGRR